MIVRTRSHFRLDHFMKIAVYKDYLPDIVLGRGSKCEVRGGLPRFRAWFCECSQEKNNVLSYLGKRMPNIGWVHDPDMFPVSSVSNEAAGKTVSTLGGFQIFMYQSPKHGWLWLVLITTSLYTPHLTRGRYAWYTFSREFEASSFVRRCVQAGTSAAMVSIRLP
jgi:hypothetical protein